MTGRIPRDKIILIDTKIKESVVSEKNAKVYRFKMEFSLKPDRQAYLIDQLLMLTRRNLQGISTTLEISENKLVDVQRKQDYLNKDEASRLVDLLFMVYEN